MAADYYDASHPDYAVPDARGAALSVAVMMVTAVIVLAVLKQSGFRAMVAVGRG